MKRLQRKCSFIVKWTCIPEEVRLRDLALPMVMPRQPPGCSTTLKNDLARPDQARQNMAIVDLTNEGSAQTPSAQTPATKRLMEREIACVTSL